MIRVEQCRSEKNAKVYYTRGDYYSTDRQELPGVWGGKGAEQLGLCGIIYKRAFDRVCGNLHPMTGEKLTARMRADRTPGYDIGFNACKSVSLLYGLTGNPTILAAFRSAYRETMQVMEAEMQARVRKGGRMENRTVGNLAWAEYVHLTARPVRGMIDPQLHVHVFVMNAVFDQVENCWKAGNFRALKQSAPRFQAMFHRRFGQELAAQGFPIAWKGDSFEITGIDRATIDKFSLRTAQVNTAAERWGITDAGTKSRLGASTREHKQPAVTLPALREQWRHRLTDDERAVLMQAIPRRQQPLHAWESERRAFALQRQRQDAYQTAPASAPGRSYG